MLHAERKAAGEEDGSAEPSWRQRRRKNIIDAAARLFASHPYHGVTMDRVAELAAVGKATLYRYFVSKEELYVAVFDNALAALARDIEAEIAEAQSSDEAVSRVIHVLTPALCDHLRGLRAFEDGELLVAEKKRRLFDARRRALVDPLARLLARGKAMNAIRPWVDPMLTAEMIIGMIWSCSVRSRAAPAALADHITSVFLHGTLTETGDGSSLAKAAVSHIG